MAGKSLRTCAFLFGFYLAGTALAMGVAWLAALRAEPFPDFEPTYAQWNGWVWGAYSSGQGPLRVMALNAGVPGWYRPPLDGELRKSPPSWSIVGKQPPPKPAPTNVCEAVCGWPWPCMYARGRQELVPGSIYRSTWTADAGGPLAKALVPRPSSFFPSDVLPQLQAGPLGVMWGGLAFDGLVWGAALAVMLLVPYSGWKRARTTLRLRKGLCAACGYPRRGLPPDAPCPECSK